MGERCREEHRLGRQGPHRNVHETENLETQTIEAASKSAKELFESSDLVEFLEPFVRAEDEQHPKNPPVSIRAQLVVAFLLLAVVPLSGVSLYSYFASERAFRQAVEQESEALAEEMERRMARVTADLGRRIERISELPLEPLLAARETGEAADEQWLLERFEREMGDVSPLLESVEILPSAAAPTALPDPAAAPLPSARRIVLAPRGIRRRPRSESRRASAVAAVDPAVPASSEADLAVVLQLEEIPEPVRWVVREAYEAHAAQAHTGAPDAPSAPADPEAEARNEEALKKIEEGIGRLAETLSEELEADDPAGWKRGLIAVSKDVAVAALRTHRVEVKRLLGRGFEYSFESEGRTVGRVHAQVRGEEVVRRVLERTPRRAGEIPFAVDGDGKHYARDEADLATVKTLPLAGGSAVPASQDRPDNWIVVTRQVPNSELTLGIARPIARGLQEIRATAVRNLGYGLGIASLAFMGILPLTKRMTRNLDGLTKGAEAIAAGDLQARVPVRSKDDFGRLAQTFNRMAASLEGQREQLVEQERFRKELELSRRIQVELLPQKSLRIPFAEVKGVSIPAREVGGDFFDYFSLENGELALLVGDVSGKGMGAALLMANAQARLRAGLPLERSLADLADRLDNELAASTPSYVYLTLFMAIVNESGTALRYVNAGHHTQYLLRASGETEPLESTGRPLGLLPGGGFEIETVEISSGDSLFLFTDGLVEMENAQGEPFSPERLRALLRTSRQLPLDDLLQTVETAVNEHRGNTDALDDATLMAMKMA